VRCEALADRLAGAVDDPELLEPEQTRHVAQCLRCQADLAHYRRLRRVMAAMRTERCTVPAELVAEALTCVDEALNRRARHRRTGRRAACLGGLAAVTAAGVGGVVVLASRRRPA
jgi:hypothetical protein